MTMGSANPAPRIRLRATQRAGKVVDRSGGCYRWGVRAHSHPEPQRAPHAMRCGAFAFLGPSVGAPELGRAVELGGARRRGRDDFPLAAGAAGPAAALVVPGGGHRIESAV